MSGLIAEIQKSCLDEKSSVEFILFKMKLAATKLELGELEDWVERELSGYVGVEVPGHRVLRGEPAAWNPYNGWIPIQASHSTVLDILTKARVTQSIGSIEDLLKSDELSFHYPIAANIVARLNKIMDFQTPRMIINVSRGAFVVLVGFVRNKILDWTIEMERRGVSGEGFTFGQDEKDIARAAMTTFNIGTIGQFSGNLGQGNSSGDVTLTVNNITQVRDAMKQLRSAVPDMIRDGARSDLSEIVDAVIAEADKTQIDKPKLAGLLGDVRSALSGAAGNLTATGVMALIASWL